MSGNTQLFTNIFDLGPPASSAKSNFQLPLQGIGICIHIKYPEHHTETQGISNSIYFTSSTLVYCKYTTQLFLSPESYSLNVLVGNPQLPNYLCSSGGIGPMSTRMRGPLEMLTASCEVQCTNKNKKKETLNQYNCRVKLSLV